jgi:lysine/ornithine N-monooxygenase
MKTEVTAAFVVLKVTRNWKPYMLINISLLSIRFVEDLEVFQDNIKMGFNRNMRL